jgi:hypothetical protein
MKSLKARAVALASMALTAAVLVVVDAAPASAHITDSCAASTDWFIDLAPAQDRVGIRSTKCHHRSTITCRNGAGARWTLTDPAATASQAFNLNVCRAANPILVSVTFHSY